MKSTGIIKSFQQGVNVGIVILCTWGAAFAQTEGEDIIVLQSGESLQGTIIEQKPGDHIKLLQKPSGDTLQITYDSIELLKKKIDESQKDNNNELPRTSLSDKEKIAPAFNMRNYYLNVSFSRGGGDWVSTGLGLGVIRTFTPRIQAGLHLSYIGEPTGNAVPIEQMFPLAVDFIYALQKSRSGRTAIVTSLSLGYNFVINREYFSEEFSTVGRMSDGLFLNPAIGYRVNFTQNMGFRVDVGYLYVGGKGFDNNNGNFLRRYNQSAVQLKGTLFF